MNILVTGANGQLGKCIRDKVKSLKETENTYIFSDVVGSDDADTEYLDIIDEEMVKSFVKNSNINVIINCAAYTNVDKAESDYKTAEALNAFAPKYLAEAALSVGAKLIHISTDYVFNGMGFMPYTEDRMTLPVSVYGTTKRMAEEFIQESGCNYLIFRTAWLYSEYGNNFVKTMMRLFDTRKEVNVVNDQIGTPTYAGNLAGLIVGIIERKEPLEGEETIPLLKNGIYHFTDEGVASWYDFAWQVYERSGKFGVRRNGVTTREYGSNTRRPYYSVLDKTKVKTDFKGLYEPKHWHNGVQEVVEKLLK